MTGRSDKAAKKEKGFPGTLGGWAKKEGKILQFHKNQNIRKEEAVMLKIRLFCANGMSTSLLVKKMEEAAKERGKEVDIKAYPILDMERLIGEADVALLGPQVGYQLGKAKEICEAKAVPVDVIPMADYGMCNGMNVLRFAFKLATGK